MLSYQVLFHTDSVASYDFEGICCFAQILFYASLGLTALECWSSRDCIRGCLKQSIPQLSEFCKRGQPIRKEVIWELTQFFDAFQLLKLPLSFTVQVCTCERDAAPECEKFATYYRSLCPGERMCSSSREAGLSAKSLLRTTDRSAQMCSSSREAGLSAKSLLSSTDHSAQVNGQVMKRDDHRTIIQLLRKNIHPLGIMFMWYKIVDLQ